jgi:hypothetical protein
VTEAVLPLALGRLSVLWEDGLRDGYERYVEASQHLAEWMRERVALAAALVESGLVGQRLGSSFPTPATDLLLGDLCLSRASRLLVDAGDQRLQVAFARAVENLAASAASEQPVAVRAVLLATLEAAR